MVRLHITVALVLLALCCVSCQKSPTPAELALEQASGGVAPTAANVIKLDPPSNPVATGSTTAGQRTEEVVNISHPGVYRHWLMLVAIILILFLLSVILFHGMARRLRQKSFRAHAPTRHADIWSSHKPPQFLDP
ncbi:MAG: hypothetical protein GWP14_09705 [Actinobacteria bacterium]|nr:hypothetical protein [Actinomycetota bacterium]